MNFGILRAFLEDQRKAKRIVFERLDVPETITGLEWSLRYSEIRAAYRRATFADVFYPHGFGLELRIGDFYIDFDYSWDGCADGFNAWQLFTYMTNGQFDNRGADKHLCDRVFAWVKELYASGRVSHPDDLYYLVEDYPRAD